MSKLTEEVRARLKEGETYGNRGRTCLPRADLAARVQQVEAAEKLAKALEKLPLDSFDAEDMGKSDAADFTDHAGEFFEAMQDARAALAHWEEVTKF